MEGVKERERRDKEGNVFLLPCHPELKRSKDSQSAASSAEVASTAVNVLTVGGWAMEISRDASLGTT